MCRRHAHEVEDLQANDGGTRRLDRRGEVVQIVFGRLRDGRETADIERKIPVSDKQPASESCAVINACRSHLCRENLRPPATTHASGTTEM